MPVHDDGTKLDQAYRRISKPIAAWLARYPFVTPNRVSVASFLAGGVVAPALVVSDRLRPAGFAYYVSDLLDYLDGDVARAQGTSSTRGDVLDGILDRYTDLLCAAALTLAASGVNDRRPASLVGEPSRNGILVLGLAAAIGSLIPSYVHALAVANGRRTTQSIGGRGTRNRVIILGLLTRQPFWTLVVLASLSNVAAIHRSAYVLGPKGEQDG